MPIRTEKKTKPVFEPPLSAWPDAGVYQLWIVVRRSVRICVGALGMVHFAPGTYVYTGRASRGLRARVCRHAYGAAKPHWHIDYLLIQRGAAVRKVVLASENPADECRVNSRNANGGIAVPHFGASDCRCGCIGHLWRQEPGPTARAKVEKALPLPAK